MPKIAKKQIAKNGAKVTLHLCISLTRNENYFKKKLKY